MHDWIHHVIGQYKEPEEFWYCYKCGERNPRHFDVCGKCGEKLIARLTVEPLGLPQSFGDGADKPMGFRSEAGTRKIDEGGLGLTAVKVLLHGFLFVLIYTGLFIGWALTTLILVSIGSLIGLGIGAGLLALGIGGINAGLGALLWNIRANTKFWNLFFHGVTLGVILLIVDLITSIVPNLMYPGTTTYIVTLIATSLAYGAAGRKVASWFGNQ